MTGEDLKTVEALIPRLKEGGDKAAEMVSKLTGNVRLPAARAGPIATDIDCDECGKPMVIRTGRRGKFLGCSGYPKCKNTAEVPAKLVEELGAEWEWARGVRACGDDCSAADVGRGCGLERAHRAGIH